MSGLFFLLALMVGFMALAALCMVRNKFAALICVLVIAFCGGVMHGSWSIRSAEIDTDTIARRDACAKSGGDYLEWQRDIGYVCWNTKTGLRVFPEEFK